MSRLPDPKLLSVLRTDGKPAPGRLVIVQGFLNTWSDELGIEDFATPQDAGKWLRSADLWSSQKNPSKNNLEELKTFRAKLRSFIRDQKATEHIEPLNQLVSEVDFKIAFGNVGEPSLSVQKGGVGYVVGMLAAIILESTFDGTWSRLKVCELESCGWAYYDQSKNQSGRWCSMKTCGSRHKAREYLKRKAQANV